MITALHYSDLLPLEKLLAAKVSQHSSISLIIPTRNEAATIGTIVSTARRELVETLPLVDEIIVMDGDSSDDTVDCARRAGAQVYQSGDVRPDQVYPEGKGTSLWRSLFVATGDILVFVDGDILDFSGRFVYGLAGALLNDPDLCFAKAYYQRPLVVGGNVLPDQGGRVTELMARPLLSLWYPELAQMYQPLSGEFAFRRDALEQIPFSSGYGVEICLLLSAWRRFGVRSLAQVDMDTRTHRNRPLGELSRMSCAILLEFLRFLHDDGRIASSPETHKTMMSLVGGVWEESPMSETRLPPVIDVLRGDGKK